MDNYHNSGRYNQGRRSRGYGGRGSRGFRPRRRDYVPPTPPTPEAALATQLFRIGLVNQNSNSNVEQNIENIAKDVETNPEMKKHFLQLIIPIIFVQPTQTVLYATVVGLLNAKQPNLGQEVVKELSSHLQHALNGLHLFKLRLLLRFCIELIGTRVLVSDSFVEVLEKIVSRFDNSTEVSDSSADRAQREFYMSIILDIIPFMGRMMFNRHRTVFFGIIERLEKAIEIREKYLPFSTRKLLSIFQSDRSDIPIAPDWIQDKWSRLIRTLTPNGNGNWSSITDDTWEIFERFFLRTQKSHFAVYLDTATPWDLPNTDFAEHSSITDYSRRLRSIFILFDESQTEKEISPAGRSIIEQYVVDLFFSFNSSHRDCANHVMQLHYLHPRFEFLIIEILFGQLFELPFPPFKIIYYGTLISDFCTKNQNFPVVLAKAVDLIFNKLDQLNAECTDRFSEWFSFHLSNFEWKWDWEHWSFVLDKPEYKHQQQFIAETLQQCIRLSYYDRIQKVLPTEFHQLLPPKPGITYEFANSKLAESLQEKIRARETGEQLQEFLTGNNFQSSQEELNLLLQVLLFVGSKSSTHVLKLFERYLTLLQSYMRDNTSKIYGLTVVQSFWQKNHQNIIIIVDKMMSYRIVDNFSIVQWILSEENEKEFVHGYLWIILRKCFEKTFARDATILQKLDQATNGDISDLLKDESPKDPAEHEILRAHKVHSLKQASEQSKKEVHSLFCTTIIRFSSMLDKCSDSFALYQVKGHMLATLRYNFYTVQQILNDDELQKDLMPAVNQETASALEAVRFL